MKSALGLMLAAVAAVLVVKGISATSPAAAYYPPPQPVKPQPWYQGLVQGLGAFAGAAVGSWAALKPKASASTAVVPYGNTWVTTQPGAIVTNQQTGTIYDSIKRGY